MSYSTKPQSPYGGEKRRASVASAAYRCVTPLLAGRSLTDRTVANFYPHPGYWVSFCRIATFRSIRQFGREDRLLTGSAAVEVMARQTAPERPGFLVTKRGPSPAPPNKAARLLHKSQDWWRKATLGGFKRG
jgi:hypothetical protein